MDAPHSQKNCGVSIFLFALFLFITGCNLITSPQSSNNPPKLDNLPTSYPLSKPTPLLPSPAFQYFSTNLVDDCS